MSISLFYLPAIWTAPNLPIVPAGGIGDLQAQLDTILKSVLALVQGIAPVVGGIGLAALGLLYIGSTIPPIAEWKNQNRGAVSNIMIGLVVLMSVSIIVSIIPTA